MDPNEPADFWGSLLSACERRSLRDIVHLASYAFGTRDFSGELLDPHPPPAIIQPRMDRHEDIERNLVTILIELPGVKAEDIIFEAPIAGKMKISGTKTLVGLDRNGFVLRERRIGRFLRVIEVTEGINTLNNIAWSMENGLLTITFPKRII